MTERKVLNKYYPPDFDPRKIPRLTKEEKANRKWVQRVMAPFNMSCMTCGEYIYKGKKFNARRERAWNEDYLGLALWRFYIRCPRCLAEITFKTDLENCDYSAEHGAIRLFEAEKMLQQKEKEAADQEEKEKEDAMKMLEKRTKSSRAEMEELVRLEELKEINKREVRPEIDQIVHNIRQEGISDIISQELKDEAYIKTVFATSTDSPGIKIKRIIEDDDLNAAFPSTSFNTDVFQSKIESSDSYFMPKKAKIIVSKQRQILQSMVKVKDTISETGGINKEKCQTTGYSVSTSGGLSLLGNYSDSDDDSVSNDEETNLN